MFLTFLSYCETEFPKHIAKNKAFCPPEKGNCRARKNTMNRYSISLTFAIFALVLFSVLESSYCIAEDRSTKDLSNSGSKLIVLDAITSNRPLDNGVEIKSGGAVMQVTALRNDVLRIRVGPHGQLPEDASWAVLAQARTHTVSVLQENNATSIGFHTGILRVEIERATMRLRITDLNGVVIQEDAPGRPVEFHGSSFRIYKTMPENEHYFGLGDKPGPLDRRDSAFSLWNTDAFNFQESTDPIYKSIPFFFSLRQGRATGIFFDNPERSSFDFGKESPTAYSFGSEGGPLDYYIFYGPDAKQVLSTFAWLTGPSPLPPLWSLGFQQSRFSYYPESKVREIADRLRADKIPADAIYLDIDYQDHYRPFTIDTERFPHFTQLIQDLKKQDFHVVAITDLHIAHHPNANYAPYDNGIAGDHFVKNPDGTPYIGKVWPGASVFPEFTRQGTRDWWGSLYKPFVNMGIAGFWNDMNEPSVFD